MVGLHTYNPSIQLQMDHGPFAGDVAMNWKLNHAIICIALGVIIGTALIFLNGCEPGGPNNAIPRVEYVLKPERNRHDESTGVIHFVFCRFDDVDGLREQ